MNLFLYMTRPGERGEPLLSALAPLISSGCLQVFTDLRSFSARICEPEDFPKVGLVWNPTKEDLRELGSLRAFLAGVRILLALPDEETETIALAHKIFPSFITFIDDDISKIVSLLEHLMEAGGSRDAAGERRA